MGMGVCEACAQRPPMDSDVLPQSRACEDPPDAPTPVRQEKLREAPSLQRPRHSEMASASLSQQPGSFQVKSEAAVERRRNEEQRERRLLREQAASAQTVQAAPEEKFQDSGWATRMEAARLCQVAKEDKVLHEQTGVQREEKLQEKPRPSASPTGQGFL
ncbi:unnamed protein product [Symbiodinium necroappetens]|uniref:Uncharacterized protein n=2 Tax=Symbiodinium TaxID=2949 RepID=A0A812PJN4_9DINO|nr:hypothetical protein AK812_SmicGene35996 [Symbiodinium microadriaticum]CAE7264982.1 unnamed protein product [Symbiodinium microadriaticum]CAE7336612.1 unnamed protein product [Symbiodinium necroappetens]CAE7872481.1 unnamed protein product [Symbiodinium sp. KB8]